MEKKQTPATSGPALDDQMVARIEAAVPTAVDKAVPAALKDSAPLDAAMPEAIPAAVQDGVPAALDEPFAGLSPEIGALAQPVAQMQPLLEGLPAG